MSSKPEIQNPKSKTPAVSPVYFPFTFIAPSLVETLCLCFGRVVLYQPLGSKLLDSLQPLVAQGLLDVCIPFEEVIDKSALMSELNTLRTWGLSNQDADLAYLKTVRNQIASAGPATPRIASEIKAVAGKSIEESKYSEFAVQLFLHLAQDFDQHSWKLREQVNRFKFQYQALQAFFQIGNEAAEHAAPDEPLFAGEQHPADFLMEERVNGWNHLFQKDPPQAPVLFTDSSPAHTWLIDQVQEKVEVLKFEISSQQVPPRSCPWKDHLEKLFYTVVTTPWSQHLQHSIQQETDQIREMIETWKETVGQPGEKMASFHWDVLPNQIPQGLLNERCGLDVGSLPVTRAKNTLIGLINLRL
jgi:hypothetical protein